MADLARSTRIRALALLSGLTVAVTTASCSNTGVTPATDTGPAPVPPGLERFYEQKLSWGPCAPFATDQDQQDTFAERKFDCARLEVPLDYAAPAGRTAQIALMRQRTGHKKIGSLVLNPGGPGGSGMELVPGLSDRLGNGPFDLVGFDPRGVGRSTPKITCATAEEFDADRADDEIDISPAGVARAEAEARLDAQHCVERSGRDVVANVGTRDVARDLDVLRAALGDRKLTYLGFSYGTRIGTVYAEMFPANVRALVLDGAVDPAETSIQSSLTQMAGFQRAFQAYAEDCARLPACPLGADPARATAEFQALSRPLIGHPAPVRGDARKLSYDDTVTAVIDAMYTSGKWSTLTAGLTELKAGDGTTLLRLADGYYERQADGSYSNAVDALLVVNCLDGDRMTDPAEIGELSRRSAEVAPFADPGFGPSSARDTCAFLPVPTTGAAHTPDVPGLPPVLVISTTGDPSTPYQAGVNLATFLRGALLTVDGTQHTAAAEGHPCIDGIVADYLVELRVPEPGARCELPTP